MAGLSVAALLVPGYPGGDEYPYLGPTGSKLFLTYLMLNLAYGGAMWIWGTLMYEEEEQETKVSTESETAEESRAA
ncbi:MAG: hypothetical protein KDA65_17610 [Planctomycetaceae bacterium]|nr:hypothetical protein [Planctomycetaceae bacterium]